MAKEEAKPPREEVVLSKACAKPPSTIIKGRSAAPSTRRWAALLESTNAQRKRGIAATSNMQTAAHARVGWDTRTTTSGTALTSPAGSAARDSALRLRMLQQGEGPLFTTPHLQHMPRRSSRRNHLPWESGARRLGLGNQAHTEILIQRAGTVLPDVLG